MAGTRKLSTILFADIIGYTLEMQKDESRALELVKNFKRELHEIIPEFQGEIIQYYGDGCLAIFESSSGGVKAGMKLQSTFCDEWPHYAGILPVPRCFEASIRSRY